MKVRILFVFTALVMVASSPLSAFAKEVNDPLFDEQWYLNQIEAPAAWDITTGNRSVIIAVIDSGVDTDHPDLEDRIWTNSADAEDGIDNDDNGYVDDTHGWDFVGNDNDLRASSENGIYEAAFHHGSIVAGIIAAETNNAQGVAGINWRARIMPIRILDGLGSGETKDAIKAVRYAVDNGADVINMSFTGVADDPALERAIRDAYRAGVMIVAATGNESGGGVNLDDDPLYPVCFGTEEENWVFGVAASDEEDSATDFTNYGSDCTDITAPGVGVVGVLNYKSGDPTFGDKYGGPFDGTSVAAPQVTAVVALLLGAFPDLTPEQITIALKLSVDPLNIRGTKYQGEMGAGRLNAERALTLAREMNIVVWGGVSDLVSEELVSGDEASE